MTPEQSELAKAAVERIQPAPVGYIMQGDTMMIAFRWPNGVIEVFECQVRQKWVTP